MLWRQAETGTRVGEVCRKMGIFEATFYNRKKKYGGLGVTELRRLKQLEEENRQLKKLVADLSLDTQMLQDVVKKSSDACQEAKTRDVSYANTKAKIIRISVSQRRGHYYDQ